MTESKSTVDPITLTVIWNTMLSIAEELGTTLRQGTEGLRPTVEKDDFMAAWGDFETVTDEPEYRGYAGNVHYVQFLRREHPLMMRPGILYKFRISFEPDIAFADE